VKSFSRVERVMTVGFVGFSRISSWKLSSPRTLSSFSSF
jgi:hypothetical protein